LFNVSWPVEITNPARAGKLNPITCRWFEAAAAGAIILGRKPNNILFDLHLHPDLIVQIDPFASREELFKKLNKIWENKTQYNVRADSISKMISSKITWKNRVERILEQINSGYAI
jgi:hypothetical protein